MPLYHQSLVGLIKAVVGSPSTGLEIGSYKGDTSVLLLKSFLKCHMIFVDPWAEYAEDDPYVEMDRMVKKSFGKWESIYQTFKHNVAPFEDRIDVLRNTSEEANKVCESFDMDFDFIFIDGQHDYDSVKKDIEMWLPFAKKLICGHDYEGGFDRRNKYPVSRAVNDTFGKESVVKLPGSIWGYVL